MNLLNVLRLLKSAVIFLGFLFPINAGIVEVDSLAEVVLYFQTTKPEMTVCGLDIDFTLTRPTHPATDPGNFLKYAGVFKRMIREHALEVADVLCATALAEQQLMEANTAQLIDVIRCHASVLGLTARYSGCFAGVDFEAYTLGVLSMFGINLGDGAVGRVVLDDMPEHRGNKPVYYNGVLFCNGDRGAPVTKPQVLAAHLKSQAMDVKRIVVVDDVRKHLEDFDAFVSSEMPGVEFQGFYYLKAIHAHPRNCTEADFEGYMHQLIRILTPTAVEN